MEEEEETKNPGGERADRGSEIGFITARRHLPSRVGRLVQVVMMMVEDHGWRTPGNSRGGQGLASQISRHDTPVGPGASGLAEHGNRGKAMTAGLDHEVQPVAIVALADPPPRVVRALLFYRWLSLSRLLPTRPN
jgi:hypothetical protein